MVRPTAAASAASDLTALHLRVLGPLEVVHGEAELDPGVWRSRRARRLLNLLVVRYPRPVPREQAMEAMWPEADPGKAAVSLRQTVFQLRAVLQQDHVLTEGETLRLELGPDGSSDAEVFTRRLASARASRRVGDRDGELMALQEAVALWRGPLLADTPYDSVVEEPAAALRLDFLRAAERLLELQTAAGTWDELVFVARRALDEDPLHEPFARALLLGLLRLGHRQDVIDTYARFESRLVRELDLLPSARLKELAEQAAGGDHSPTP
jgi:DNA-binding SARP family transcriptional activator